MWMDHAHQTSTSTSSTLSMLATALVDVQQAISFLFVVFLFNFIGFLGNQSPVVETRLIRRHDYHTMPCREHSGD